MKMTYSKELLLGNRGRKRIYTVGVQARPGTVISHLHVQRRIIFFWDRVAAAAPASLLRTRTRRKKTGEEEGRGPRSRERARWNEADKASYRGGAGPDGIALPVSCLSRHVLAGPTRNRLLGYLDDSFLVLVPIHASEVAPGLGCPRRHRVSRDPGQCR